MDRWILAVIGALALAGLSFVVPKPVLAQVGVCSVCYPLRAGCEECRGALAGSEQCAQPQQCSCDMYGDTCNVTDSIQKVAADGSVFARIPAYLLVERSGPAKGVTRGGMTMSEQIKYAALEKKQYRACRGRIIRRSYSVAVAAQLRMDSRVIRV